MIAGLKSHPAYRDSGVPWLGEVPEHWGVVRLWRTSRIRSEKNRPELGLLSVFLGRGVIPYAEGGGQVHKPSFDLNGYQVVYPGDLVLNNQQGWRGSVGVSRYLGIVSPAYIVLSIASSLNSRFADYLFQSRVMVGQFVTASKGVGDIQRDIHIPWLKNTCVPVPSSAEQAAIVRFLDHTDRRIRRYIRAKQKMIKLLEEQKRAIIHQAVTRGLDPSVRLKASGVGWLGDVPEHWEVRRLKFEMGFCGGGTPTKAEGTYWNGDIPWVSPKDMKTDMISDAEDHITERAVVESSTRLVPRGSILMVVRSGILQRTIPIACCDREVALNQDMKALSPKGKISPQYFILLVRGCEKALLSEWTKQGATVESIEHEFLANTRVPIPPVDEQHDIARFVDGATVGMTAAIDRARREVSLLREYRTRLIADVVTGKLDVRDAAANLPDEPEAPEGVDEEAVPGEAADENEQSDSVEEDPG